MKHLVIAVMLVIVLSAAPAFAFTVTVPEETIVVPIGATKEVSIRVDSAKADDVSFSILDPKPWITQSDSMIKVTEEGPQFLKIFISPFMDTPIGVYKITILAESLKTGEQQKKFLFVSVNRIEIVEIEKIEAIGNFTPTGQVRATAWLKNYKLKTAENVKVVTSVNTPSSQLIEFEQNIESIDPGEIKNVTYSFTLPKQSEAGLYSIVVKASSDGETREKTKTFSVVSQANFIREAVQKPLVFGFSKYITVTNIGNVVDDAFVTDRISPFEASFYSGETPASVKGGEFTWLVKDVSPGESRTLSYKIDYTPLFVFILVVLVAVWVFFFKIRIIKLKKFILERKFIEEGEEFTVGVEIKNSTGRKIENAEVKDFVPSVFNIKDGEGPKPTKKKTAAGTELTWKVRDIHKNEERILSYKILPVFGVHGTIRLPQASVTFQRGKKQVEIKSAFANIGIETEGYGEKEGKRFFRKKK
ncbi:MAG: hypothetical protein HY515_00745 [Candidatus Aenigmarchaeota archaeon]|nr:hypothetical protein [Candidatus Aenigmarchaeota archaeon]